jgi:hypothetical protein
MALAQLGGDGGDCVEQCGALFGGIDGVVVRGAWCSARMWLTCVPSSPRRCCAFTVVVTLSRYRT